MAAQAKDEDEDTMEAWAYNWTLSEQTVVFLKKQGYTTLKDLSLLTQLSVKETIQIPQLLPHRECQMLMKALEYADIPVWERPDRERYHVPTLRRVETQATRASLHHEKNLRQQGRLASGTIQPKSLWKKQYKLLLVGKKGSGKTSTASTILHETISTSPGVRGFPLLKLKRDTEFGNIEIAECPAAMNNKDFSQFLRRGMEIQPDAILYVVQQFDFDNADYKVYNQTQTIIGDVRSVIVVFTKGDKLNAAKDAMDNAPTQLTKIVRECGNRYVSFNNKAKGGQRQQVANLLRVVDSMKMRREETAELQRSLAGRSGNKDRNENQKQALGGQWAPETPQTRKMTPSNMMQTDGRQQNERDWEDIDEEHEEENIRGYQYAQEDKEEELFQEDEEDEQDGKTGARAAENLQDYDSGINIMRASSHLRYVPRLHEKPNKSNLQKMPQDPASTSEVRRGIQSAPKSQKTNNPENTSRKVPSSQVMEINSGHPQVSGGAQATQPTDFRYADKEEFRFLLLGKTGSSKSTTGNTIFGEEKFFSSPDFGSVTAVCEREVSTKNGKHIEILDSPGLFDTSKEQGEIGSIIVKAVAALHPGASAVLYVIRAGRYTDEEYGVYQRLKAVFDEDIIKYTIVIITGGDMYENQKKTIDQMIDEGPEKLKIVMKECHRRYVVFNNFAPDPRPQVERLLNMVRNLVRENGNKLYECERYKGVGENIDAKVKEAVAGVEKQEMEKRETYQNEIKKKEEEVKQKEKEIERERKANKVSDQEAKDKLALVIKQNKADKKALQDKIAESKREVEEAKKSKREEIKNDVVTGKPTILGSLTGLAVALVDKACSL